MIEEMRPLYAQWAKDGRAAMAATMEPMTRTSDWSKGTGRAGFADQIHDMWRTRPVRLPQQGSVESLNVSVAAGMLLYEAVRQRVTVK